MRFLECRVAMVLQPSLPALFQPRTPRHFNGDAETIQEAAVNMTAPPSSVALCQAPHGRLKQWPYACACVCDHVS